MTSHISIGGGEPEMVLAANYYEGLHLCREKQIPNSQIVTPHTLDKIRGRKFKTLIIVEPDDVKLSKIEAEVIVARFQQSAAHLEIADALLGLVRND